MWHGGVLQGDAKVLASTFASMCSWKNQMIEDKNNKCQYFSIGKDNFIYILLKKKI